MKRICLFSNRYQSNRSNYSILRLEAFSDWFSDLSTYIYIYRLNFIIDYFEEKHHAIAPDARYPLNADFCLNRIRKGREGGTGAKAATRQHVCWSRRKKKKRERPISGGFREVNRSGPVIKEKIPAPFVWRQAGQLVETVLPPPDHRNPFYCPLYRPFENENVLLARRWNTASNAVVLSRRRVWPTLVPASLLGLHGDTGPRRKIYQPRPAGHCKIEEKTAASVLTGWPPPRLVRLQTWKFTRVFL